MIMKKIPENVTKAVELALKVEKSNWKRLHGRSKWIKIKHVVFRNFGW